MKRTIGIFTVVLLLAGMAMLVGCGGSSGQSSDTGAKATEPMQQGGAQGGMQGGRVREPDLTDVPIYPGAEKQTMAAGGPGGMGGAGGGTPPTGTPPSGGMPMVMYTTTDSADTVAAWYREQLSGRDGFTEATGTAGPDGTSATIFTFKVNDITMSVMISTDPQGQGGTMIRIAEGDGQMPSGAPPGQSQQTSQ